MSIAKNKYVSYHLWMKPFYLILAYLAYSKKKEKSLRNLETIILGKSKNVYLDKNISGHWGYVLSLQTIYNCIH